MISPKFLFDSLNKLDIDFFTGVPDSLLKNFCAYITDNAQSDDHIINSNEGNAIAICGGYYLATKKIGLVYMQNSGEGNAINPLASLMDKDVYNIPVLLLIGWRGEPGRHDEPQHKKQGKITLSLLETLGIKYELIPDNEKDLHHILFQAKEFMEKTKEPFAIIAREGIFDKYELKNKIPDLYQLTREKAIQIIIDSLKDDDIIVSTTGKASRELFEIREGNNQGHEKDFLTVGSMGHASSIALGVALKQPKRNVYCLDGDGAIIMHMGSMAIIGQKSPKNFRHILLNNGSHESVGGQPTAGFNLDFLNIAKSCGYKDVLSAEEESDLKHKLSILKNSLGPSFLEIKLNKFSRNNLGRPTKTPIENKEDLMGFLNNGSN